MIEQLWRKYSEMKSPEAREKLIMACLPYVKASAHRLHLYSNNFQDVNDLVSAGIIGLIGALERYDPHKGASFKNYAKYRIRGSIIDEIRAMSWVPYSTRNKARKMPKVMQELERKGDGAPGEEEIAEAMGMSLKKYQKMLKEVNRMTLSLLDDAFLNGDASNVSEDMAAMDPGKELVRNETEAVLCRAIETLLERERLVITLYYHEEMTMKEIGKTMDITESMVCKIHANAILHLHTKLSKFMTQDLRLKI